MIYDVYKPCFTACCLVSHFATLELDGFNVQPEQCQLANLALVFENNGYLLALGSPCPVWGAAGLYPGKA